MKKAKGFTLVELLVAISIMAVLAVVGITIYSVIQKNARDSQRLANLHNLSIALEAYYSQYGEYPCTYIYPGTGKCCNASGRSEQGYL